MDQPVLEELKPAADDLLVFIDDTGHEALAGNQGFYGLGGCVVLGLGYEHLKTRWRAVRGAINGNPDSPLHGSTMERKAENFKALADFFRKALRQSQACYRAKACGSSWKAHSEQTRY